jgi:hypothetical protein
MVAAAAIAGEVVDIRSWLPAQAVEPELVRG